MHINKLGGADQFLAIYKIHTGHTNRPASSAVQQQTLIQLQCSSLLTSLKVVKTFRNKEGMAASVKLRSTWKREEG